MGLISEYVEVGLCPKTIKYYENLGYDIPRRKDNQGRITMPRNTKIKVKVKDLHKNSKVKVMIKCDYCNKKYEITYENYNRYKHDEKYYCTSCTSKLFNSRENNHLWNPNKTDEEREQDRKYPKYTEFVKKVLATKRMTVVTQKDLIQVLGAIAPDLREKKTKVKVKGNVKLNYYNGNTRLEYHPTSFEIVGKDAAYENVLLLDVFYEKDSIEDEEKEKKMYINGYLAQKVKGGEFKLYPVPFVLDYSKIDTEDPDQKLLLEYNKGIFDIKDKKQVHKVSIIGKSLNGAEIKEFDESCLTARQKMSIALGQSKIEDFKPKSNIYGNFITEYKIITDNLVNQPDGTEQVFPVKELIDYLSYDDSDKKAEDVKVEENEPADQEEKRKAMMAKLFG